MCGIAGFVDLKRSTDDAVVVDMTRSLSHRGPDAEGIHLQCEHGYQIGMGHRRLSIIDPGPSGNQPMYLGPYVIVLNGEIYNFKEVRKELQKKGCHFHTQSDTEVALHAFIEWGEGCVERFIGMFAFVVYSRETQILLCCRDRAGVKPLYWYYYEGLFLFGSELKALMAHPKFERAIDPVALRAYFQYGYVPSPTAIFKHTKKLNPGAWLRFDIGRQRIEERTYWSIGECYGRSKFKGSYQEAVERIDELLDSAINYRMVADVPVGLFLSGGYDSTMVAAKLQRERIDKVKTFTIGFAEGNDESIHARTVASYLGTDHEELVCSEREAKDLICRLPHYYDEPFSDSSAIPTMLVSRFAREKVKVAMSADGGDELFAGYGRYLAYLRYSKALRCKGNVSALCSRPLQGIARMGLFGHNALRKKVEGLARALRETSPSERNRVVFKWMNSAPDFYLQKLFRQSLDASTGGYDLATDFHTALDLALANDHYMYLQNDILTKVDRATMSFSLEGREPLLDHQLTECVATLPDQYKVDGKGGKRIFKEMVHQLVPRKVMDRPKAGFSVPIDRWLRGDLRYLLDEYLGPKALDDQYFDPHFVGELVERFHSGSLYFPVLVWRLLCFQMWSRHWKVG